MSTSTNLFRMPDWGGGCYETFAAELQPAAAQVVALVDPRPGMELLDLACGTGNAALLAARTGANVTGLDLSPRLIEVARERAAAEEVPAAFVVGDVQDLPFEDAAFDLALSVFGVIFAPEPRRALSEMLRVLRPDGRALLSVWSPAGALDAMIAVVVRGLAEALGAEIPRFPWDKRDAVAELASSVGGAARFCDRGEVVFTADSPAAYLELQESQHPLTLASRALLEHAGTWPAVRAKALAALRDGNEDPRAFRATSAYEVVEFRHAR